MSHAQGVTDRIRVLRVDDARDDPEHLCEYRPAVGQRWRLRLDPDDQLLQRCLVVEGAGQRFVVRSGPGRHWLSPDGTRHCGARRQRARPRSAAGRRDTLAGRLRWCRRPARAPPRLGSGPPEPSGRPFRRPGVLSSGSRFSLRAWLLAAVLARARGPSAHCRRSWNEGDRRRAVREPEDDRITRRQIMGKLGIHSVAGLTKYALREGITALEE